MVHRAWYVDSVDEERQNTAPAVCDSRNMQRLLYLWQHLAKLRSPALQIALSNTKKKHVWEVDTSFLSYCFGLVKSWDDYIPLAVWVNLLLVAGCSNLKMARKTQNSERAGCLSLHCLWSQAKEMVGRNYRSGDANVTNVHQRTEDNCHSDKCFEVIQLSSKWSSPTHLMAPAIHHFCTCIVHWARETHRSECIYLAADEIQAMLSLRQPSNPASKAQVMPAEHLSHAKIRSAFTDFHSKSDVKWATGVPVSDPMVKCLPRLARIWSMFHVFQIISGFTKVFVLMVKCESLRKVNTMSILPPWASFHQ